MKINPNMEGMLIVVAILFVAFLGEGQKTEDISVLPFQNCSVNIAKYIVKFYMYLIHYIVVH